MATTKPKVAAPTDEELSQMLEGLEENAVTVPQTKRPTSQGSKAPTRQDEQDILAELENLGADLPPTRPHTPRVIPSIKRIATPPTQSSRTSEDKASSAPRRSGESTRSFHTSLFSSDRKNETPQTENISAVGHKKIDSMTDSTASGGWWGSVFATANAAVKTAEAAMKDFQQNEEAKRWAEQVKGNVGILRGIGGQISSRALPTFTNILHTLAPPISPHERLRIHITHDFVNYPSLNPLVYSTFSRVMAQVESGELLVIQRGQESTARRPSEVGYSGGSNTWNDGPWWRQDNKKRDIGAVMGLVEGTKLVRVSAEAYANEYFNSHGGLDQAVQRATEDFSDTNPVRRSDIFFAVQSIIYSESNDLFKASVQEEEKTNMKKHKNYGEELLTFAIYLYDPVHSITFHTLSQSLPAQWVKWLDASSIPAVDASNSSSSKPKSGFFSTDDEESQHELPAEIIEIIQSGGIDPREWVSEWVEESLSLATGVVAQRYIARRMGVEELGQGQDRTKTAEE